MSKCILQDWVMEHCTLRMQGALISAVCGCAGVPKEDVSKKLVRTLRGTILNSPVDYSTKFLAVCATGEDLAVFLKQPDQYQLHWLIHFMHAAEVIAYMHPEPMTALFWENVYYCMCNMLHVNHETIIQFKHRLSDGDKGDCWKT